MQPPEQQPPSESPPAQQPHGVADDAAIELARRQVRGPALGLLVVGMLSCLAIPAFVLVFSTHMEPGPAPPPPGAFVVIVAVSVFFLVTLSPGSLTILAAVKMKGLKAYWLAVTASILAVLVSPLCCFVGLPIGIWSLVVLSQREVRMAFARRRQMSAEQYALTQLQGTSVTGSTCATMASTIVATAKVVAAVAIIVTVAILACLAFRESLYLWQESQIPAKARLPSIERKYRAQLDKMAEYAYDYEQFAHHATPHGEEVTRLFSDPAIVEATVHESNTPGNGFGVKWTDSRTDRSCSFDREPSIGKPVLNLWSVGNRHLVEYAASVTDRKAVERSYTILFDPSKMDGSGK